MGKSIKYHDYLIESLKDPKEAAGYLNAALDDGDIDGFLEALHHVAEAYDALQVTFCFFTACLRFNLYNIRSI